MKTGMSEEILKAGMFPYQPLSLIFNVNGFRNSLWEVQPMLL
jgi:hypothetical protein